jgi:hypothetical protein
MEAGTASLSPAKPDRGGFLRLLREFDHFGRKTEVTETADVLTFTNEFWTSDQRRGNGLHEVPYRACFKPELPAFFIDHLAAPGGAVHDPFMGRGTTVVEAALKGRPVSGADINPLSEILASPRLNPPTMTEIEERLGDVDLNAGCDEGFDELLAFYHPETLGSLISLRRYFLDREAAGSLDSTDAFIRMVATTRLTGHSSGFFSVYTLPPNQAVSAKRQLEINRKRGQEPPVRDVKALILKKSRSLLRDMNDHLREVLGLLPAPNLVTGRAWDTPEVEGEKVEIVVTSPPFLDVIDYRADNWLRCWFAGIDPSDVEVSTFSRLDQWTEMVNATLIEQRRLLRPGGHVCFEVGEVRSGTVRLEEMVLEASEGTGLSPVCVVINSQEFTKTSHLWGVDNASRGTNSHRIVVLRRD